MLALSFVLRRIKSEMKYNNGPIFSLLLRKKKYLIFCLYKE